ncbi:MAG: selenocysteine-specific translation elongation factor [Proteobacteria bacterium]|nr:selenocysteine-specific translation elongation factor [Pseudomonadota bacterium]
MKPGGAGRTEAERSRRLILGTAGHIDHGKTSLIRALSGVDCDRLPEEKARGITIELGFAPLELPSGRGLGVVDVPGHERLVRTMVSGATGIDLVLFAVAADEGIMPQSREHLAICSLLGIDAGVVALTKADAVEADLLELARLEVEEELAVSSLDRAEVVAVSAHTGRGMDELIAALERAAERSAGRTLRDGPAWLPVDRTFSMRGFGTVVTGTLRGSELNEGQNIEILPEGGRVAAQARIRGLQVHGETVARAEPGSRCAVNLQGVEVEAVPRGSVLATPGRLDYRDRVEAEVRLLDAAPPLDDGARVALHVGTSERPARIRLLDAERLEPGDRAFAQFRFDSPVPVVEGDRFILRGYRRIPEAGWTIGGGVVLDAVPARGRRRRKERSRDLQVAASGDRSAALAARLKRAGLRGATEAELLREVRSLESLDGVAVGGGRWLHREAFAQLERLAVEAVRAHHAEVPTDPWVGFAGVRARVRRHARDEALRAALAAAVRGGALLSGETGYRAPEHVAHAADEELAERLLERICGAGLAPDTQEALARELGCEARALQPVLDHWVRQGRLERVAPGRYFDAAALEELSGRLVAFLKQHGEIDPVRYKQLTGQTRKHTVPLMEYFDARKVTRRVGNTRVLRKR